MYTIYALLTPNKLTVLYVGSTKHRLKKRIRQHTLKPVALMQGQDIENMVPVVLAEAVLPLDARKLERFFIERFHPPFNTTKPGHRLRYVRYADKEFLSESLTLE